MLSSYKDLRVWQESMKLVVAVYGATAEFPRSELYGLTNQIRRAAVSIPSNIAEGKGHRTDREFSAFLLHARGSLLELQTQIMIARDLRYLSAERAEELLAQSDGVGRGINALLNKLRGPAAGRLAND